MAILSVLLFWALLPESQQANEASDYTDFYDPVARNLLSGRGLTTLDGNPAARYPLGYPIALAAVFYVASVFSVPEQVALHIFILAAAGVGTALLYSLALIFSPPSWSLAATGLWVTYLPFLWLHKQPNSEVLFIPFLVGTVLLFWSSHFRAGWTLPRAFACGVLSGIAMLIRPAGLGVGIVLALTLLCLRSAGGPRRRVMLAAMIIVANAATVAPWELWMYGKTGRLKPLSTGGMPSMIDGLTFTSNPKSWREKLRYSDDLHELMTDIYARRSEIDSERSLARILWSELLDRPLPVAKLFAVKAARSWFATDSHRYEKALLVLQIPYLLLAVASTGVALRRGGAERSFAIGLWLMVFYFWAMTIAVLSILRYMTPAIGLLFALLPFARHIHLTSGRERETRSNP